MFEIHIFVFMITIFDYKPTSLELDDIRFDSFSMALKFGLEVNEDLTPEVYKKIITQENAYYDLAILFEFRGNQKKANEFWSKLPPQHKEDGLGGDYAIFSV